MSLDSGNDTYIHPYESRNDNNRIIGVLDHRPMDAGSEMGGVRDGLTSAVRRGRVVPTAFRLLRS